MRGSEGLDPFNALSEQQLADMKAELDTNPYGLTFEVDWAGYQCADQPPELPLSPLHLLWPDLIFPTPRGDYDDVTYCGEGEPERTLARLRP